MINSVLNMIFSIGQVAWVGGAAFIIGTLFGMILMACLAINDNDD